VVLIESSIVSTLTFSSNNEANHGFFNFGDGERTGACTYCGALKFLERLKFLRTLHQRSRWFMGLLAMAENVTCLRNMEHGGQKMIHEMESRGLNYILKSTKLLRILLPPIQNISSPEFSGCFLALDHLCIRDGILELEPVSAFIEYIIRDLLRNCPFPQSV
jgi:hypothetical protein